MEKPKNLKNFGRLTISHVANAKSGSEHEKLVWEWARNVWNVYHVYRESVENWIEEVKNKY